MIRKIYEKVQDWYYAGDGVFDSISVRNILFLVALVYAAHC